MQIIKYEINKSILSVGFKEDNFVVYSQITYDSTKTKQELLQKAYEQCRYTIAYEKTQVDHSIITEEIGEEFIPEKSKLIKISINSIQNTTFQCLKTGNLTQQFSAIAYDQYGSIMISVPVLLTMNVPANCTFTNGLLTIGQVDKDYDLTLIASYDNVVDKLTIHIKKYNEPPLEDVKQNKINDINNLYNQSLINGFESSATGKTFVFGYGLTDILKFLQLDILITKGIAVFPVNIPAKDNTLVSHTLEQYNQLVIDIAMFAQTQNNKQHEYINNVIICENISDVETIIIKF